MLPRTRYGRITGIYDELVAVFAPAIPKARRACLDVPGARNPLIVACGTGSLATEFVNVHQPARLTVNDLEPAMLARTRRRMRETAWQGDLIESEGDILTADLAGGYDVIVVPFLLNCFGQGDRMRILKRLRGLLAPGGVICVADFSRPRSRWMRIIYYANYFGALGLFFLLARNPLHAPGDTRVALESSGFEIAQTRVFARGLYSAWFGVKCQ
jgi:ubiquinone/menaquinone biosynthesis C-methylase UbiE